MTAELIEISSSLPFDNHNFEDQSEFYTDLTLFVGSDIINGHVHYHIDLFTFKECEKVISFDSIISGQFFIIVKDCSWEVVDKYITKKIESCKGETWKEVIEKVGRWASLELEDCEENDSNRNSTDSKIVTAKLIGISGVEDLSKYVPPSDNNILMNINFSIACGEDSNDIENFELKLCTPKALEKILEREHIISGRHYLFVKEYNWEKIYNFIKDYVETCKGETWDEVIEKVGRFAKWEK